MQVSFKNNPGHTVLLTDPDNFKYMLRCKILEFKMHTNPTVGLGLFYKETCILCFVAGIYFTQMMNPSHGGMSKNNCLV